MEKRSLKAARIAWLLIVVAILDFRVSEAATTIVVDSLRTTYLPVIGPDSAQVVNGGVINTQAIDPPMITVAYGILAAHDNAHVLMAGGEINVSSDHVYGIDLRDSADLTMTSGSVAVGNGPRSYGINSRQGESGTSNIAISGGSITASGSVGCAVCLYAQHPQSEINFSFTGGSLFAIYSPQVPTHPQGYIHGIRIDESNSSAGTIKGEISGGLIKSSSGDGLIIEPTPTNVAFDIVGGEIEGFNAIDAGGISRIDVSGGLLKGLSDTITVRGRSRIDLSGGTIETQSSHDLNVLDSGVLNIHLLHQAVSIDGTPVSLRVGQSTPILQTSGVLAGTLMDGTAFEYTFRRSSTGSINLIATVPEPSAIAIAFVACCFIASFARMPLGGPVPIIERSTNVE